MPDKKKKRPSHKFRKERWDKGLSKEQSKIERERRAAQKERERQAKERIKAQKALAKEVRSTVNKAMKEDAKARKEKIKTRSKQKISSRKNQLEISRQHFILNENKRRTARGEELLPEYTPVKRLPIEFWESWDDLNSPADSSDYNEAYLDLLYDENVDYEPFEGPITP